MDENPLTERTTPACQDVLDALDDPDCRTILRHLDEPRSAAELIEATGIARSTLYRKLDLLHDGGLVREITEIRRDGSHAGRYEPTFGEVRITLDESRKLRVRIDRPDRASGERTPRTRTAVREEL